MSKPPNWVLKRGAKPLLINIFSYPLERRTGRKIGGCPAVNTVFGYPISLICISRPMFVHLEGDRITILTDPSFDWNAQNASL